MLDLNASEIIPGAAIAVKCGTAKKQFDQAVVIRPSDDEEFVTIREKPSVRRRRLRRSRDGSQEREPCDLAITIAHLRIA